MKKLLVAGDSFAQLAGYRDHFTTRGLAKQNTSDETFYIDKADWPAGYRPSAAASVKHWVELLADDIDATVQPHGVGGAGVSSSAFVALQQLITDDYSGCVFFISHHGRSIAHKNVHSVADWSDIALHDLVFARGLDVYRNSKLYAFDQRVRDQDGTPCITHVNSEDLVAEVLDGIENDYPPTPEQMHYLLNKTGYSYLHDAVSSVVMLNSYCVAHNIPIVFASCFTNGVSETIEALGIPYKHFPFALVEDKYDFTARDNLPSHYNSEEHKLIYTEFKKQYPEYVSMFNQNS